MEIIILCGGFAHSYKATLNGEVVIWSFRCLDETEFREFVLKKFKRQRVGADRRSSLQAFLAKTLGLLRVAGRPYRSQRATEVPDRRSPTREANPITLER